MKKWQKINMGCFLFLALFSSILFYVAGKTSMSTAFEKPWHLQPSVHEDSLTQVYKDNYAIFDKRRFHLQVGDSSRTKVIILVDAWGVPIQENLLAEEFSIFTDIPHVFALHHRLANRTKHAEKTEFRETLSPNIYLFGGDSTEYKRTEYVREIGFSDALFCQRCTDSVMLEKLDSLLSSDSLKTIAWTTQSSRSGDRDSLLNSLKQIGSLAKRHPKVLFVVQGTHRPILGSPETRNSYKAHWVPAVILNNRKQNANE